jgi:hypothetical protein
MKTTSLLIILTAVFFAQISSAQVYKWVDEKGVVHFTDDMLQVPEKYRPKTEKMEILGEKPEPKVQGDTPSSTKKEEPYKDRMGRGEEYWKEKMEFWKKKLMTAQDKAENLRMKYNDLTEKLNASNIYSTERANLRNERDQIKNEIDKYKQEVEEAKIMLDKKLPEEAQLNKAKPEWVKP